MPQQCSVCTHPQRDTVEQAIAAGRKLAQVSAEYELSADALSRHRLRHMSGVLAQARQAGKAHALDLVEQMRELNRTSLEILQAARQSENAALALRAIDRLQRQLSLQARLLGEDTELSPEMVLNSPTWIAVRTAILRGLENYPDARQSVLDALEKAIQND